MEKEASFLQLGSAQAVRLPVCAILQSWSILAFCVTKLPGFGLFHLTWLLAVAGPKTQLHVVLLRKFNGGKKHTKVMEIFIL